MHPRNIPTALAIATAGFLAHGAADAALSLSIADTIGDPLAITIAPGDTFTFKLSLVSTAESTVGLTYRFAAPGAGSGQFQIAARDTSTSSYSDLVTSDAIALNLPASLLDPANDADLGALLANIGTPNGIGSFDVATLSFTALVGIAEGVYTIQTTSDSIATDEAFGEVPLAPVSYTVTVVPEPGSALLGLAGFGVIAGLRRRR